MGGNLECGDLSARLSQNAGRSGRPSDSPAPPVGKRRAWEAARQVVRVKKAADRSAALQGGMGGVSWLDCLAGLVGWAFIDRATRRTPACSLVRGALVLIAGLALTGSRLKRGAGVPPAPGRNSQSRGRRAAFTPLRLSMRGLARRRSRSVATAGLLACGSFLILSIGVFRLDANRAATERTSGTGGFALIGESTIPVGQDLNTPPGREFFALDEQDLQGVECVQFRLRAGDDASCLNLNRAQRPRLLGVDPEALDGRFTFAKVARGLKREDGWRMLDSEPGRPGLPDTQTRFPPSAT